MAKNFTRITVHLDKDRVQQLDARCAMGETTRAGVIREAVSAFLDGHVGVNTNFDRIAMTSEFTQAAVDILIREQAPDRRDEILATVEDRMEKYHAQG